MVPKLREARRERGITSLEDLNHQLQDTTFLKNINIDRQKVCAQIKADYPAFCAMCEKRTKAVGKKNTNGSTLHYLLADVENTCLLAMVDHRKEAKVLKPKDKNVGVAVLMFLMA